MKTEPRLSTAFLHDDPGGGRYLPVLMKGGMDTLLMTNADRGQFMKSIATSHLLYTARHDISTLPSWMSHGYLTNKRLGTKIFNEKGLGDKVRMYEGCVSKVVEIGFGASPSGLSFAAVRPRGQGFRRRLADRGFPIHRLCASGFGRKRGAPRGASALFRDTAARSVF